MYQGKSYQPGAVFEAGDGCNRCGCSLDSSASVVFCTERDCAAPASAERCVHAGRSYKPGETFPAGDGCNTCVCGADGLPGVACSMKKCGTGELAACSSSQVAGAACTEGSSCFRVAPSPTSTLQAALVCTCSDGKYFCTEKQAAPGEDCSSIPDGTRVDWNLCTCAEDEASCDCACTCNSGTWSCK